MTADTKEPPNGINAVHTATSAARNGTNAVENDDPICVVGMACRLPGSVRSPSDLWDFLINKKSGQGQVPDNRFNIKGFYHPDGKRAGTTDADGGYFIQDDIRQFEPSFFGINNVEATYMDPQQRKLIEVVFECLESAGVSMEQASGSNTGVYVGNWAFDYISMQTKDTDYWHRYTAAGVGLAILSNRISHVFNLCGPSFSLDTGCSSSTYCLHQAVNSLKAGDCETAIVASANLIQSPEMFLGTTKAGVLSPTSTCHTFDISADGYARGEAVNAIYLKRLSAAIKDDNKIWAVIRGSAINANGKTPGITQPSVKLQEAVVRKAYESAGLSFSDTDYVECHGTGTAIGDPMEVEALGRCFSPRPGFPLGIGSVKTNLGHSEGASGLSSLIKVALAFEHGIIPPTIGVKTLNPAIRLDAFNMEVVTDAREWPRALRRASINCFGYGGANSHIIVDSIDSYIRGSKIQYNQPCVRLPENLIILPTSAASGSALRKRVEQVYQVALQSDSTGLQQLAATLGRNRSHFPVRGFHIAAQDSGGTSEIIEPGPETSVLPLRKPLPFAFVFTGQGAQYAGMARDLLLQNRLFRGIVRDLDRILQRLPSPYTPNWTMEQAILEQDDSGLFMQATHSQPLCTAIQIGLTNLLYSWGIKPSAVVGHSSGEIAAAYAAGLLSSSQAILAAYLRGYAGAQLQTRGAMLAVGMGPDAAKRLIDGATGQISIACINSPKSVTLSGEVDAIESVQRRVQQDNIFVRRLETGGRAYHSYQMREIGPLYEELLSTYLGGPVETKELDAKMYSSVGYESLEAVIPSKATDMARYWRDNLEKPVFFDRALSCLISNEQPHHLIEIGPHPALKAAVLDVVKASSESPHLIPYSSTLHRKVKDNFGMKSLAGKLFRQGYSLDWDNVNGLKGFRSKPSQDLPPYPWDYSAGLLWKEPRQSSDLRQRRYLRHELLGVQPTAGSGVEWRWRNVLRLDEVRWLDDHKIDSHVVFPAAGYLAMIVEAASQALDIKESIARLEGNATPMCFSFRDVSINTALVLRGGAGNESQDLELHTVLSARKLSNTTTSSEWYDFSISSWLAGAATVHCVGGIHVDKTAIEAEKCVPIYDGDTIETRPMEEWYNKLEDEGLSFGPAFRSLKTTRFPQDPQIRPETCSTTIIPPRCVAEDRGTYYPMHPITIDACLQTAIVDTTGGDINALRGYLPVFISDCQIIALAENDGHMDATMQARSNRTGFATHNIECTLWDPRDMPLMNLKGIRMSLFAGKTAKDKVNIGLHQARHPCLRVLWKPDITRLSKESEAQVGRYVLDVASSHKPTELEDRDDGISATIAALLDIAGHQNPRLRVLELLTEEGVESPHSKQWRSLLGEGTAFPRLRSWDTATLRDNYELAVEDEIGSTDLLLVPQYTTSQRAWKYVPDRLKALVGDKGVIVTRKTEDAVHQLETANFTVIEVGQNIILGLPSSNKNPWHGRQVIVMDHDPSAALKTFADSFTEFARNDPGVSQVTRVTLADTGSMELPDGAICVSLLEMDHAFLTEVNEEQMAHLRYITSRSRDILWLRGADALDRPDPSMTLSSGLARSVMMEDASLRFTVADIGMVSSLVDDIASSCQLVSQLLARDNNDDKELSLKDGLVYISRYYPDVELNSLFQRRIGTQKAVQSTRLSTVPSAKVSIGQVGVTESIHLQELADIVTPTPAGFIDIDVKTVSLNAKDIYALSGRVETRAGTTALEFAGVVRSVGADVLHLSPGDRVAALMPNYFSTTERVPAWAAIKMLPDEDLAIVPTLLTMYCSASYALKDRGRLQAGESILIHSGAGAFGIAAITIAQTVGATIYTTVGSDARKAFLIRELGVPESNIFYSRDKSFADDIRRVTKGAGVDVVINSLVGDLMHASWDCIADFGRFVEIGKRELVDAGRLDMRVFLRNATFTAFDMSDMFYQDNPIFQDIMKSKSQETIEQYRAGQLRVAPITTFDVSEISQAYRYFSSRDRVGKVVVSLQNPDSYVPVAPSRYQTTFSSEKVYLLVGCLGGLGRSISRFMVSRGARKLVFLARSGADKPRARSSIEALEKLGAQVWVVRGDVALACDVKTAIEVCKSTGYPVGGVVHAPMTLDGAIFENMTSAAWHAVIRPKCIGALNIEAALEGNDEALDFFLLFSSMSGTVGSPGEANYSAANTFLDTFAYHRRSRGKPAVAIGLGIIDGVGYVHENPEVKMQLMRTGCHPLSESEFLQMIDLALLSSRPLMSDPATTSHLLGGLEILSLLDIISKGFEVAPKPMKDPRGFLLAAALENDQRAKKDGSRLETTDGWLATAAPWLKTVPSDTVGIFKSQADCSSLETAVLRMTLSRFSSLILLPVDQIDGNKPLVELGVDSLTAVECRTWIMNTFGIDVPVLDLLSPQTSLKSVATSVTAKLVDGWAA